MPLEWLDKTNTEVEVRGEKCLTPEEMYIHYINSLDEEFRKERGGKRLKEGDKNKVDDQGKKSYVVEMKSSMKIFYFVWSTILGGVFISCMKDLYFWRE